MSDKNQAAISRRIFIKSAAGAALIGAGCSRSKDVHHGLEVPMGNEPVPPVLDPNAPLSEILEEDGLRTRRPRGSYNHAGRGGTPLLILTTRNEASGKILEWKQARSRG
jgi:hypothetical protein